MKKPMYSVEEIHNLVLTLEKDRGSFPPEAMSVTKESLSNFILYEGEIEGHPFQAFQGIASEAYNLEQNAKRLRKIARSFKCPIIEVPKLINDENSVISEVAKWRLKLGR